MSPTSLPLPDGVVAVHGPSGVRLTGPTEALLVAVEGLRFLRDRPHGFTATLDEWTLQVSEFVPDTYDPLTVSMPGHAWNIAASVLADAVRGEYGELPFDFGQAGYLIPRQHPDIGIAARGDQ